MRSPTRSHAGNSIHRSEVAGDLDPLVSRDMNIDAFISKTTPSTKIC